MILIEDVTPVNFRGIKQLTLSPNRRNFGVCGPNGCGKSGIVDAVEFALTGNITRLSGEGTGNISVRDHAPHVDSRREPNDAYVLLKVFIPSLNRSVTLERRVSNPKAVKVTPDDDEAAKLLRKFQEHPEFALSRREIVKFVLTEPGKRSKEVQALLKLDGIEKVRASLKTLANNCKREVKQAENDVAEKRKRLLSALEIDELKPDQILQAVSERRRILGLSEITTLEKGTSLKEGLEQQASRPRRKLDKASTLHDLSELLALTRGRDDDGALGKPLQDTMMAIGEIEAKPSLLSSLRRQNFLKSGVELLEEGECPFCEEAWDLGELRRRVLGRIEEAKEAQGLKQKIESCAAPIAAKVREMSVLLTSAAGYAAAPEMALDASTLRTWANALSIFEKQLVSIENVGTVRSTLSTGWQQTPPEALSLLEEMYKRAAALPDSSKEDRAKAYLVLCDERLDVYRASKRKHELDKKHCDAVARASELYNEVSETILGGLYQEVEKDFSRYYQFINQEDEAQFRGKLEPSTGKLSFDVEFYGRGLFPPGAYHSEGHQDGMGLCLYLALMKRILGESFTFAILDDVLMSVDVGHRKEVCRLLKKEFPDTQFIITTHDIVWLQQMISEGVMTKKSAVHFRKWSVEHGPMVWDHKEVWDEINADLEKDDIPRAGAALRRFLEHVASDLCLRFRVRLEVSSTGNYDLGEMLPAVTSRFGELLGKAKDAAQSWSKNEVVDEMKALHEEYRQRLSRSNVEQWAINPAVHYNAWANFQRADFEPVVNAFRSLLESFKCKACSLFVSVTPVKGNVESLRCDCNDVNINLKRK